MKIRIIRKNHYDENLITEEVINVHKIETRDEGLRGSVLNLECDDGKNIELEMSEYYFVNNLILIKK